MRIQKLNGLFGGGLVAAVSLFVAATQSTQADTGTWTNYVAGSSLVDYWTNNASWSPTITAHPGMGGTDSAYLTNQVSLAYTNILDAKLNNSIVNLAISNALGEAWLVITNTALTNSTSFALGNGGRLRIDNGGQLFTTGNQTIGAGGGVTGLVTSASGPGNGGVWNRGGGQLTIGGASGNDNLIQITGGVVVTNSGALTLSGQRNRLLVTAGGKFFGGGAITFSGTNATFTLGDGFWTHSGALTINGRSNAFNIVGGMVSNVSSLNVGTGAGADFNSLIVTNGGRLMLTTAGGVFIGATSSSAGGSGNTVILSNSVLFGSSANSIIGWSSSNNTLTLLEQTIWNGNAATAILALGHGSGRDNLVMVSGAVVTNFMTVRVGSDPNSVSNRMVVKDGGKVFIGTGGLLVGGHINPQHFNSLLITNGGQVFVNAAVTVGTTAGNNNSVLIGLNSLLQANSLTVQGGANSVTVTNGGQLFIRDAVTIGAAGAINNTLLITAGGLLQAQSLIIAGSMSAGNTISNVNGTYQFTNAPPAITPLTPGNIALTDGTISFRATGMANVTNNQIRNIRYAGANTFTLNNASNTMAGVNQTYTFDTQAGNPSNYARLVMVNGPTAYGNGNITIGTAGSMLVSSTTATISGLVTNTGSLSVVSAKVTFQSPVLNDGTLTFLHSVGTFNSAVINRGAWITDPTTNIFLSSYTVTTNGYVSASAGDVFRFHNGLQNQSTNNVTWQTLNVMPGTNTVGGGTLFEFAGTSVTQTQVFSHPGLLLTGGFVGAPVPLSNGVQDVTSFAAVTGFQANFALGQLWLTNMTLVLTGGPAGALFVNDLFLFGGARLVVSNDLRLYFVNSNGWDMANITLLGNGEIHQLRTIVVIPEPNVLLLCLAGFTTLCLARRRPRI